MYSKGSIIFSQILLLGSLLKRFKILADQLSFRCGLSVTLCDLLSPFIIKVSISAFPPLSWWLSTSLYVHRPSLSGLTKLWWGERKATLFFFFFFFSFFFFQEMLLPLCQVYLFGPKSEISVIKNGKQSLDLIQSHKYEVSSEDWTLYSLAL